MKTFQNIAISDIHLGHLTTHGLDRLVMTMLSELRLDLVFRFLDFQRWAELVVEMMPPIVYADGAGYACVANRRVFLTAEYLLPGKTRIQCRVISAPTQAQRHQYALMEYLYLPFLLIYANKRLIQHIVDWFGHHDQSGLHKQRFTFELYYRIVDVARHMKPFSMKAANDDTYGQDASDHLAWGESSSSDHPDSNPGNDAPDDRDGDANDDDDDDDGDGDDDASQDGAS